MQRINPRLAVLLVVSLATIAPLQAESSPEAVKWLEKMARSTGEKAYRVNYSATMNMPMEQMGGQQVAMEMKGKLTQADPKHMRMDMNMTMQMPGMGEMAMSMTGVADGQDMWMEMENPMLGGKQVMKLNLEKMKEMGQAAGGMGFGGMGGDPVSQVAEMVKWMDFNDVQVSGGKVTLRGTMTEEGKSQLGAGMPGAADLIGNVVLVLDEKTGFLSEMRMGGEQPVMVMRFDGLELLDKGKIDASTFQYTPPEGVQVMDMGAMMGGDN